MPRGRWQYTSFGRGSEGYDRFLSCGNADDMAEVRNHCVMARTPEIQGRHTDFMEERDVDPFVAMTQGDHYMTSSTLTWKSTPGRTMLST